MFLKTGRWQAGELKIVSALCKKRLVAAGLMLAAGIVLMPSNAETSGAENKAAVAENGRDIRENFSSENGRAAQNGNERVRRVMVTEEVDRSQVENLQRWVAAGHEDWCRDARQVAAAEMHRLAADFVEGGLALNVVDEETGSTGEQANVATFEWTPADGRALYRVTVEKFAWLLPIAGDVDSMVWVPTGAEIWICEGQSSLERLEPDESGEVLRNSEQANSADLSRI